MKYLLVLIFLLSGCIFKQDSDNQVKGDTGSLAPKLLFKRSTAGNLTIPSKVDTVRVTVTGSSDFTKTVDFLYSEGGGEIDDIPVGLVTVKVDGIDITGSIIFTGEMIVEIIKGQLLEPVLVLEHTTPIGLTLLSPLDGDTVNTANITLTGRLDVFYDLVNFTINGSPQVLAGFDWNESVTLQEGPNEFQFLVIDRENNVYKDTVTIYLVANAADMAGPVITFGQYSEGSVVSVSEIYLSGSISDPSGVQYITINGDTATITGHTWWQQVTLDPGDNQFILQGMDNNNNVTVTYLSILFDVESNDSTNPVLSINFPADNAVISSNQVSISGFATDENGIYSLTVNGDSVPVSPEGQWIHSVPLSTGENGITVTAMDNSESRNTTQLSITVFRDDVAQDNTPPIVDIESPSNNQTFTDPDLLIYGSVFDVSTIDSVSVNDSSATYNNGTWSANYVLTVEGSQNLVVVAYDNAGNSGTAEVNVTYRVDPQISITSHANGDTVTNVNFTLAGIATDNTSLASVSVNSQTAIIDDTTWSVNLSLDSPGLYLFFAIATDLFGNTDTTSISLTYADEVIEVDEEDPQISITSHAEGDTVSVASITVSGTATDNDFLSLVTVNSQAANISGSTWSLTVALDTTTDAQVLSATAADSSGNNATTSITIIYYVEPPKVWSSTQHNYNGANSEHADIAVYNDQFYLIYHVNDEDATIMTYNSADEAQMLGDIIDRGGKNDKFEYLFIDVFNGTPWISYDHKDNLNNEAGIARLVLNSWAELNTPNIDGRIDIEFDSEGSVYVASSGAPENPGPVRGGKYTGNNVSGFNSSSVADADIEYFALTVPGPDNMFLCWANTDNSNRLTCSENTGGSWSNPGTLSQNEVQDVDMESLGGEPYVVYQDFSGSNALSMKKYTGSSWDFVGTQSFSSPEARYPAFTFADGQIYVAYLNTDLNGSVEVMRFDGSEWVALPATGYNSNDITDIDISVYLGNVYITTIEGNNNLTETHLKYE